jgi:hypothetical protein
MTNSTQVLKPNATEQVMHALAIALAGAGLIAAGWFGNLLWKQNEFEIREARLDTYEIELQQWATQAANTEFAAKRQTLVNELYNQTCVIPAGLPFFSGERSGVLINGVCYVPTNYGVESQIRAKIPAPPEP